MTPRERQTWSRIEHPRCDLCSSRAAWRHADGGLRCAACPCPKREPECPIHGDRLKNGKCATCDAARRLGVDEDNPDDSDPMNNGDWT